METRGREAFVRKWHKQQIVIFSIVEKVSSTLLRVMVFLIFVNRDAQGLNHRHFEIEILNAIIV